MNEKKSKRTNMDLFPADCRFYRDVIVVDSELGNSVSIGDFSIIRNSNLSKRVEIGRRNTIDHAEIGKNTYTGEFCIIKHCSIGNYCAVSWNVSIGGANHDIEKLSVTPISRIFNGEKNEYRSFNEEHIIIGNDVWIAAGAHILRGVKIGDGAVVAANAVVTHNVEPYAIVGGVPAKKIGQRFDDKIINKLKNLTWWDWSESKLLLAKDLFKQPLSESVLEELEKIDNSIKEGN